MSRKIASIGDAGAGSHSEAPAAAGLDLYKFVKKDSWRGALTTDATGENLPRSGSAWIYEKPVLVRRGERRVGATSGEIIDGVSERGFFLFPISDDA